MKDEGIRVSGFGIRDKIGIAIGIAIAIEMMRTFSATATPFSSG